jgi:hypothetical protein
MTDPTRVGTTTGAATSAKVVPAPTSRAAWIFALTAFAMLLMARIPVLRDYVSIKLAEQPDVVAELDDPHLHELAINIGLALVVVVATGLFVLYQSLGRLLESHVYTASLALGRLRVGLFFLISTGMTIPVGVICLTLYRVSMRTSPWYYVGVILASAALPLLFRRHWRSIGRVKVAVLFVSAVAYGMFATLI